MFADTTHVSPAIFVTTTALLAFVTRPYGIFHPANRPTWNTSLPLSLRRSILSRTVSFRVDLSLRLISSSAPSMAARMARTSANVGRFASLFFLAVSSLAADSSWLWRTGKGASLDAHLLLLDAGRRLGDQNGRKRQAVVERRNKARHKLLTFTICKFSLAQSSACVERRGRVWVCVYTTPTL